MSSPTIIPDQTTVVANGKNGVDGTHKTHDVTVTPPATIIKRDGRVVEFDTSLIERALVRCFASFQHEPQQPVEELARQVVNVVAVKFSQPTVEEVQDIVEMVLQAAGEYEAAKRYILYRAEHAKMRSQRPVPESVREAFEASDDYFPTQLQKFQFYDKYSRFNYDLGRRETWIETVDRAVDFLRELSESRLPDATYARLHQAILEMRALPSMRLLAMAGPAARRNNVAIYNCSYMPVDSIDAFVEALIISMSGCGVGFSVERRYVENFPRIRRQSGNAPQRLVVEDSSEGWADALRVGLETWFEGGDMLFDYSLVRPAGAPLRTKGGRASGPEPLRRMLDFARTRILARQGGFLRPLDAHDIMCMVGEAAVSGGVRRCLPAGTRVHTRRGAIPIEEVTTNDEVMTPTGYQAVTGWFDQGVQDIVEILTESGTIFRCTPHHRVAVLTDVNGGHTFKRADALSGNDRLLFITHAIDGEATALLPLPEKRPSDHSGSNVHQPVLDTETAWFLGKFFADGYVRVPPLDERGKGGNTNLDVASDADETDQIERIARWMVNHGLRPRLEQPENEHCVKVRSANRQIARWMHQYKQARTPLQIPEAIWRGTKDVRAAFIAGVMDGDGSVADRPTVIVHTAYPSFGREMVKLLATLGIIAEFRRRRPADEETGWQAMYYVSVKDTLALQKCIDTIGLFSCKKFVPRKVKQSGYTMPRDFVRRDVPRKDFATVWNASGGSDMNSTTLATITGATHFVPVKVIEVKHIETQAHTYDIEVREGSMFVAEGYLVHNTAMISLFDHDDNEMRLCKSGDFSHTNSQRWNANNSAVWPDYRLSQAEIAHSFLEMVDAGRGEPGIFNRQAAIDNRPERREAATYGTNPCIVGETWVAVADGRGRVQIRDLVAEDKDVDVYTVKDSNLVVRTMRNPRKTGTDVPIYRVSFADGTYMRVTANHKFQLKSGEWVEAVNLRPNDALVSLTVMNLGYDKDNKTTIADYDCPKTYRMLIFNHKERAEHRFLYEHHTGNRLPRSLVIHHRDFNSLNNALDNLEPMTEEAHAALHDVRGASNPNALNISNDELEARLLAYISELGYRPSVGEYVVFAKGEGLPQSFQAYRKDYFGGTLQQTLIKIAEQLGVNQPRYARPRATRGLPVHYKGSVAYVTKICEFCGEEFEIEFQRRDTPTCKPGCGQRLYFSRFGNDKRKASLRVTQDKRKELRRQQQIKIYNDLVVSLDRHPMKDEWIEECKRQGVSPEISRVSSPFRFWTDLQDAAATANHRVVSVEHDGYEDVYNGTVDDTHSYFTIGCARQRHERSEMSYVLSKNCGEIVLRERGLCNLSIAVARPNDTFETLKDKIEVATIIGTIQSMAVHFPGLRPQWRQNCEEERLLGVDITGQMDSVVAQDPQVQEQLRHIAIETNQRTADALGIAHSAAITCVKPSGNSSQLLNCSPGLHTRWAPYYVRNVRVAAHSPIFKVLRDAGVPMDPENGQTAENANTWVIHFPVKSPDGAITRHDRSALEQCNYWLQVKTRWTEHNPSCTITYRPDEVIGLMQWIWDHQDKIGGLAFLPASDAQYDQMPYEEITEEEYLRLATTFPQIDFSKVYRYEEEDLTTAAQELACLAGSCDIF